MKKFTLILFILLVSVMSMANAHIFAYGLNVSENDEIYTFSFNANENATSAKLIFYDATLNTKIGELAITTPVIKGANVCEVAASALPGSNGQILNWAVELTGASIESFTKVYEDASILHRMHAVVDASPESNYFGRIYMEDRVSNGEGYIYVRNTDYSTILDKGLVGQTKWQSAGRPSIAPDGKVFLADYGDSHGGIYVMDPTSLTATSFFNGTQNADGVWSNTNGINMGSSSPGCHVYGTGENMKLFVVNEDAGTTLVKNGYCVYNIGQADGSYLTSWNQAPSQAIAISSNANGNFSIIGTSHGAWLCQNRGKGSNLSDAYSLMFYDNNGTRQYASTNTTLINGSSGAGMAISPDENQLLMVNGEGNLLLFDITWTGNVPTLTLNTTYTTGFSAIGSLHFDYAGNIIASAGTAYGTSMRLVVYAPPTNNNTCEVPAKKSLTITTVKTTNTVVWNLNGGYYFPYADKNAMYLDLGNDIYASGCSGFKFASTFKGTFGTPNINGSTGVAFDIQTFDLTFFSTEPYKTKWEWLKNYLDAQCTAQSAALASSEQAFMRYNLAAFFANDIRSTYPISANYSKAGKIENWIASFSNGESFPTTIATSYTIPDPVKPYHTFDGWYDNSSFEGTAITSIDNTYDGYIYARYTPIAVTGITLDKTSGTLPLGSKLTLEATITPANAYNKNLTWGTNDASIATVANGIVTAVGVGTTTITATTVDGNFVATYEVTVNSVNMNGEYKVGGTEADFATLYEACDLFNKANITGDVTFLICSNLTENKNVGLSNSSDYSLTIRPDQDINRTITLNQAADNVGPSGGLVIGGDQASNIGWEAIASNNIIIDGYANEESTHKMKITTGSTFGVNAGPIIIYGKITNSMIKNCQLITDKTYVVTFRNEQTSSATTNNAAQGFIIDNCDIQTTSSAGQAIYFNGSKATTANTGAATNTIIRNCNISAKVRGMFFNGLNNITIEKCTFNHVATSGNNSAVLFGNGSAGNIIIKENKFIKNTTANTYADGYGLTTIYASGGGTWYIDNNLFSGYDLTVTTKNNCILKAIRCGSTCVIRHNTFIMDELSNQPANTLLSDYCTALIHIAAGSPIIQNNIFVLKETASVASIIRGALNANCTNNVMYKSTSEGCKSVYIDGAQPCTEWANVEASYGTYNNRYQEVAFTDGYKIADAYIDNINLAVPEIEEITTDIEGNTRHSYTYAGCYEASDIAASLNPSIKLMNEAGTAEAGWVNFGSFVTAEEETTLSNSITYTLNYTDIDITSATVAIEIKDVSSTYFTAELNEDKTQVTVSYSTIPANVTAAYKGELQISAKDLLGETQLYSFPISLDINPNGESTNLNNISNENGVQKIMRDGHIYIIRNGIMYNVAGQIVK